MAADIDPKVQALAEEALDEELKKQRKILKKRELSKRGKLALREFLSEGSISTEELAKRGYEHPPRVVMDIKDAGIPIVTTMDRSPTSGKPMAVYSLGTADAIQARDGGGRRAFPKAFKKELADHYGGADRFSGAVMDLKTLSIDHRIPYSIGGDAETLNVADYMLLDGSSQRSKSWACEHCPNMAVNARNPEVCMTCYWAFPETYRHIATVQMRRTDIAWQDTDVAVHDKLKAAAEARGSDLPTLLRSVARQIAKDS